MYSGSAVFGPAFSGPHSTVGHSSTQLWRRPNSAAAAAARWLSGRPLPVAAAAAPYCFRFAGKRQEAEFVDDRPAKQDVAPRQSLESGNQPAMNVPSVGFREPQLE